MVQRSWNSLQLYTCHRDSFDFSVEKLSFYCFTMQQFVRWGKERNVGKRWKVHRWSKLLNLLKGPKYLHVQILWSACFSRLFKKSSLRSPTACPWNELSRIKKLANSSKPIDDYTRVHYRLTQINYERLVVPLRTGSSSLSLALPLSSHRLSR